MPYIIKYCNQIFHYKLKKSNATYVPVYLKYYIKREYELSSGLNHNVNWILSFSSLSILFKTNIIWQNIVQNVFIFIEKIVNYYNGTIKKVLRPKLKLLLRSIECIC